MKHDTLYQSRKDRFSLRKIRKGGIGLAGVLLGSLLFGLAVANQPTTVHADVAGTAQVGNEQQNGVKATNNENQQQNVNKLKNNQVQQKVAKNNNTLNVESGSITGSKSVNNLSESKVVNNSDNTSNNNPDPAKQNEKDLVVNYEENISLNDRHNNAVDVLVHRKNSSSAWIAYGIRHYNGATGKWDATTDYTDLLIPAYTPEDQQFIKDGGKAFAYTPTNTTIGSLDDPLKPGQQFPTVLLTPDMINNWEKTGHQYRMQYYPSYDTATINYIDGKTSKKVVTITGNTDQPVLKDVNDNLPKGYVLDTSKSSDLPSEYTQAMDGKTYNAYLTTTIHLTNSVNSNAIMPTNGKKYPSDVTDPTNFKQSVKRTVTIDIPNGKPQIINQEVDFTRTANITKEGILTWGNWTPASGTLVAIKVPEFAGYTASVKEVPAIIGIKLGQKVDSVTINYTKNPSSVTSDNSNSSSSTSTQLNPSVPENTNNFDNNTSSTQTNSSVTTNNLAITQTQPTTATVSNTSSDQTTNNSSVSTKVTKPAVKRLVLTHNAFVYTKSGRLSKKNGRIITWKRGRNVSASSKIVMIGSKKFYKVGKNAYIKVSNTVEKKLRAFHLTRNAKVYKLSRGKMVAIKNASLKKGFVVKALYNGNGIKNHGAVYYCIGKNRYIKAGNTISKK